MIKIINQSQNKQKKLLQIGKSTETDNNGNDVEVTYLMPIIASKHKKKQANKLCRNRQNKRQRNC